MALKDLEGKRTGRPPGAKAVSPVRRDILWAYRNLGKPDAKPPSPGAKMWAELAREQPGRFLACVARIEAAQEKPRRVKKDKPRQEANGTAPRGFGDGRSRRVKMTTLSEEGVFALPRRDEAASDRDLKLPFDAHIVDCETDVSQRRIHIFICSESFREVLEGQSIP